MTPPVPKFTANPYPSHPKSRTVCAAALLLALSACGGGGSGGGGVAVATPTPPVQTAPEIPGNPSNPAGPGEPSNPGIPAKTPVATLPAGPSPSLTGADCANVLSSAPSAPTIVGGDMQAISDIL